jgi:glycerol-3-phosphate acyltransferase PlsY
MFTSVPRNAVEAASAVLCLGGSLVGIVAYRDLVLKELATLGHVFPVVEFVGGGDVATAGAKGLAAAGNL